MTAGIKLAAALSGGVDSSVAAALVRQQGYRVLGITLWLMRGKGSCCSDGMKDAARVCEQLGIAHHIVDVREQFEETIVDFLVTGYQQGVTPLPCSRCNKELKFGLLLDYARHKLGIDRLATGHYARNGFDPETDRHWLARAVDRAKDQSYFLYDLSQEQLASAVFPLGELTKDQTRAIAAELGLSVAHKPESMDLCLVEAAGSMRNFLDNHIDTRRGEIVDTAGKILGEHDGAHHYTVGQRRGLGVAAAQPLYVVAIDAANNRVVVGGREEALTHECIARQVNWVSIAEPTAPIQAMVQVRYRAQPVEATIIPLPENRVRIVFTDAPQFAICPGQAAVWYGGDRVLGGGIIA
ncbi:tRNA 2-thiouridine(34) synthase MnmA [Gloeobacter kilaueensis]|uniref:tRNA-specific 2-thiouridylase MnmA n=1 Tax=Gloeobacter kilaueensis (strain ATCC BAA-2537 / CCAP 1431/1 / ULC 316 / JS1) TaxID=1183438 RepID=U5QN74_GLOK1|nr:tRNA 2-thiouridine(34) synthase MnmA [Gloeobacter kilaueensis]AGY60313.1 tRNA-specific 2-thiouridylase MnmA [Gloeobacter kilaueensis JS1]